VFVSETVEPAIGSAIDARAPTFDGEPLIYQNLYHRPPICRVLDDEPRTPCTVLWIPAKRYAIVWHPINPDAAAAERFKRLS